MGGFFGDGKCRQLFFCQEGKTKPEKTNSKYKIAFKFWGFDFFNKNLQMFHLFSSNFVQEANNAWIIAFGLISSSSCTRTWQFLGREIVCPPLALGKASPPPLSDGEGSTKDTVCSKMLSCWLPTVTPASFQKVGLGEDGDNSTIIRRPQGPHSIPGPAQELYPCTPSLGEHHTLPCPAPL